jgi:hypothetical protein
MVARLSRCGIGHSRCFVGSGSGDDDALHVSATKYQDSNDQKKCLNLPGRWV